MRVPNDNSGVMVEGDPGAVLLGLYDQCLPQIYGYLLDRCGDVPTAEDLTAETFMAAAAAVQRAEPTEISVPWIVGVARHKLVDHWRRRARDERLAAQVAGVTREADDPWDAHLDAMDAKALLARLGAHHRAALMLRYVDGLPVAEVALQLDRTVHATEALLVRARIAYRKLYESAEGGSDA
jgi:RNA polymerase sigma-70 factor, ECF subfamily